MPKKIVRKNSQSRIDDMVNTLRYEVMRGEYAIGAFLPSESDLEKRFRLGNNSVRRGLERLVTEGIIQKIPRVGNKVIAQPSAEHIVLNLGIYQTTEQEMAISKLLEQFHLLHPNIRVELAELPVNGYTEYIQGCMADRSMDAAILNNYSYRRFTGERKSDWLEPLEKIQEAYSFTESPFMEEGQLLVRPLIFSPLVLCYNKDHLQERDLQAPLRDWTWDQVIRLAEQLAIENERFGFSFHLLSHNRWPLFLLQSGVDFTPDEQGRYHLSEERLIECFDVCRRLLAQPHVFPTMLSGRDSTTATWFMDGKVSMILTTYFSLNRLKQASGLSYDLAAVPSIRENRNLLNVIGVGVNRKSQHKEAAMLLADFLGSYEAQLIIRQHTLSIPAHGQAAEWQGDAEFEQPSNFGVFRDMIPSYRTLEDLSLGYKKLHAMQKELELYLTGLQDGYTMCRRMESALFELDPPVS